MKGYDAFAGVVKCLMADTYVTTGGGLLRIDEAIEADGPVGFVDGRLADPQHAGRPDAHLARLPEPARGRPHGDPPHGPRADRHARAPGAHAASPLRAPLDPAGRPAAGRPRRRRAPPRAVAGAGPRPRPVRLRPRRRAPAAALPDRDDPRARPPARLPRGRGIHRAGAVPLQLRRSRGDGRLLPRRRGRLRRRSDATRSAAGSTRRRACGPSPSRSAGWAPSSSSRSAACPPAARRTRPSRSPSAARRGRSCSSSSPPTPRATPTWAPPGSRSRPRPRASPRSSSCSRSTWASSGRRSTINGYARLAFLGADAARLARLLRPYLVTPRKREAAAGLAARRPAGNPNLDVIPGLVPALRSLLAGRNGWVAGDERRAGARPASGSSTAPATTSRTRGRGRSPASSTR